MIWISNSNLELKSYVLLDVDLLIKSNVVSLLKATLTTFTSKNINLMAMDVWSQFGSIGVKYLGYRLAI